MVQGHKWQAGPLGPATGTTGSPLLGPAATIAAALVFALDINTELGFAAPAAYVFSILLAGRAGAAWLWALTPACSGLVLVGYALSPDGGELRDVVANRTTSVALIAGTALICQRGLTSARLVARQTDQLMALLEAAPVGMLLIDHDGSIGFMNHSLRTTFGYASDELVGRPVEILIPKPFRSGHPALREQFTRAPKTRQMGAGVVLAAVRKDGSEFPVEIGLNPIETSAGPAVVASVLDTSERKAAHAAAAHLAAIVEGSEDAIISLTLAGMVTSWNRGAQRLYGYTPDEIIGRTIRILVPASRHDELSCVLARVSEGDSVDRFETQRIPKSGPPRDVTVTISPIRDERGVIIGASAISRDETDRRRQERRLAHHAKALERANQDLDGFVYAAAHDLRSPLDGLRHLTRWVAEDNADILAPESRQHLSQMERRVQRLERLLADLLLYARAGQPGTESEDLAVDDILADVIRLLSPPPGFEIVAVRPLPKLTAPRHCIQQVLHCLIDNAVKHHDLGCGRVLLDYRESDISHEFTVTDDGPGIPLQFRTQVFRLFETLRPRDEIEGSGMGLAIVEKIVERYGGNIQIESAARRGTTVRFTWPKATDPAVTGSQGVR